MHVEPVRPPHIGSLVDLLGELHAHYHGGAREPPQTVRAHLVDHLLVAGSPLRLVVACDDDGAVLGMAAITLTWSLVDAAPAQCRQCQLKELYVRAAARGRGVGHAIMAWVARHAVEQGVARIDWPVQAGNARGIAFYQRLGAQRVAERLAFRLGEPALSELAGAAPPPPSGT